MRDFVTTAGRVRGLLVDTPDGEAVAVLGLPTGRIPERFRPAAPPDSWHGVRESARGPAFWQEPGDDGVLTMSEEHALTANVWLPSSLPASPRPVLVWVHGGAHLYGSNSHPLCDGARLAAAHGLIVVAISYRLGALGFLRLDHVLGPDYADAANLALRDTLVGIEWVRDEITVFGGDPSRITVMGQSAGAAVVATLLAESGIDAPFQRVIMESATAERVHTLEQAAQVTAELLERLGGRAADPEVLLRAPVEQVIAAQQHLVQRWRGLRLGPGIPFRPIIDGRFVHGVPIDRIAAGAGSPIDAIIGTNRNEASGYVDLRGLDDATALDTLAAELDADGSRASVTEYIEACAADDGFTPTPAEALESAIADRLYRMPVSRMLDARRHAEGRTYAYLFSWSRPDTGTWSYRAGHSLELPFVFRHVDDSEYARSELGSAPPSDLSVIMSASWASFVASGQADSVSGLEWPTYGEDRTTIVFDDPISVVEDPFAARRYSRAMAGP